MYVINGSKPWIQRGGRVDAHQIKIDCWLPYLPPSRVHISQKFAICLYVGVAKYSCEDFTRYGYIHTAVVP